MSNKPVIIHTDGACRGNPGPGGWAAVLRSGRHERELYGYEPDTTNNRMELFAVIQALEALTRPCDVRIVTDSQYVMKGVTQWMENWKRRGWRTAARTPVRNVELWQRLDQALARHRVQWEWVRGHAGHDGNERADALANRAIDEGMK
jgi:ribonuclease HI